MCLPGTKEREINRLEEFVIKFIQWHALAQVKQFVLNPRFDFSMNPSHVGYSYRREDFGFDCSELRRKIHFMRA